MKPFPAKYEQDRIEADLRTRWAASDAFRWQESAPAQTDYVIDTPPPTVSGTLHVGHVYSYTQADILARYFRMSGRNVLYPIGWDDNGLPTERLVEKVRKVRGGDMPRGDFVQLCREVIPSYEDQFRGLFSRLALSVDWSREYQTISDESRTVSQLSFLDLFNKGLVERRLEPVLWDPADRTVVAQAEVDEIERQGTLNYIPFAIEGGGEVLIATTRPELLGACVALMIHPQHPRAAELSTRRAISPLYNVLVPIVVDDAVDPDKGSGIVMCCTFGDVTDIQWWRRHSLPLRVVIDRGGRLLGDLPIGTHAWPCADREAAAAALAEFKGLKTEKAREAVIKALAANGLLRKQEATRQIVPVAERSGAALEIIVTAQWFIKTLAYRDEILAAGREVTWRPDYMRQRFESWVSGLKWDWAISRQRHFGVAFPVWYSKRAGEEGRVIVAAPQDLPVDPTFDLPDGYRADEVERETDVMDTWATSSVTPQLVTRTISAELGADQPLHRRLFPMALRPQSHEIIRSWAFYTIVKALHHQRTIPWRTIAVSGWCLASDGSKMSKSKGNVLDPIRLLDEHGSDAVRYWTGNSRLGNDTVLSVNMLQKGRRLVIKLWNAAKLAHIALARAPIRPVSPRADVEAGLIGHDVDRWLLGRLSDVVAKSTEAFEDYEYAQALRITEDFFWQIYCDNYLELVKARATFTGEPGPDQLSALHTLHHATTTIIRLLAPFVPFVTDALRDVFEEVGGECGDTIHARGQWPKAEAQVDPELNRDLGDAVVEIVAAARKVKSDLAISLRAPVARLTVGPGDRGSAPDAIRNLPGGVWSDLKSTLNADLLAWADHAPPGQPNALSPGERFRVHLEMAETPAGG